MFWTTIAYAMGGGGTGAGAGGEPAGLGLIPIALMFLVFYLLFFRPQQKRNKAHKAMLAELKRGDEIVTAGGLFGRIHEVADEYVILEVGEGTKGEGTRIKVLRSSISTLSSALAKPPPKKAAKKDEPKEG